MRSRLTAWCVLLGLIPVLAGCGAGEGSKGRDAVPTVDDVEPSNGSPDESKSDDDLESRIADAGKAADRFAKSVDDLKKDDETPKTDADNPDGPEPDGPEPDAPAPGDDPAPFAGRGPLPPLTAEAWANQRNGDLKHGVAGTKLPAKLELLWKKEFKWGVPATCAIAGGHVYVPTLDGFLYCFDKKTGDIVWQYRSIEDADPKKFAPGFKAAPTVTADTVYTGDEDGLVHAIVRTTGKKRWTHDTLGEVAGGPTVIADGKSLLVTSHGGGMARLKADDGSVEWQVGEIGPINLSPPIVDGKTFALGCETGQLVTMDVETGKEVARMSLAPTVEDDPTALGTPAVLGDRMYLGMYDGRVVAIDYAASEFAWTFRATRRLEFHASVAVTEDSVFAVGRNKFLHRLNRTNGDQVWMFPTEAQNNGSPVVAGDRVFFTSDDEHVYGVSIAEGDEVFKFNLEGTPPAGPAIGEGVLVVGTQDNPGAVFCFGEKE